MAFFTPLGPDRWMPSVHTNGPWTDGLQHGGPPSALLGRACELVEPRDDTVVARVTVEILGPVPVAELELRSRVLRPGRSVELVEAALSAGGRDVARASAWRIRRAEAVSIPSRAVGPAPLPEAQGVVDPQGWGRGYLQAMEWRWVSGGFAQPGPATVWGRMLHPLVPDEEPSPLSRVLIVADSGNGVSAELDIDRFHFINPELTVHLHREAVGKWICLDAATAVSQGGTGLATSVLSDVDGPIGVGAQSLLVAGR